MDYKELFKHINKYKWFIIIIPVITVVITHFMVKDLPKQYVSQALLSTGFVDQSKQVSGIQNLDFFKTGQQFANIIEKVKLKKVMSMLSYSLIIHDLENPRHPFKGFSKKIDSMSTEKQAEILEKFKSKLANRETMALSDATNIELYQIVASMWYDEDNLNKSLIVSHTEGSDFISVTYTSNNPELSAFVVNTLCTHFIDNNNRDVDFNQSNSIALLDSLLQKKELIMNQKIDSLKNFKTKSGVLNLENQSESAYAQLTEARGKRDEALRQIQANQGAIASIEAKLRGKDPYINNTNLAADNREILDLRNQLKTANDKYIDEGFKQSGKKRVDSLTTILNAKLSKNTETNIIDPTASRQNLIQQRTQLQIALDQAKSSITSLNNEI
ncbi:MAG TPA: lipopolysaccharide biosynthesis protein, partial [Mucilaginibacter sp.]